jgi:hypothetical protein
MDSSQIFGPAPGGIPQRPGAADAASGAAVQGQIFPRALARTAAGTAGRLFFVLLERLDICRAPRIVSAECLAGETRYIPADAAPRMDEAGILTDLAV